MIKSRQNIIDAYNALVVEPEQYLESLNLSEGQMYHFEKQFLILQSIYNNVRKAIFPGAEDSPVFIYDLFIQLNRSVSSTCLSKTTELLTILQFMYDHIISEVEYVNSRQEALDLAFKEVVLVYG